MKDRSEPMKRFKLLPDFLSCSFIAVFLINMIGGAYGVMSLSTMVSYCLAVALAT